MLTVCVYVYRNYRRTLYSWLHTNAWEKELPDSDPWYPHKQYRYKVNTDEIELLKLSNREQSSVCFALQFTYINVPSLKPKTGLTILSLWVLWPCIDWTDKLVSSQSRGCLLAFVCYVCLFYVFRFWTVVWRGETDIKCQVEWNFCFVEHYNSIETTVRHNGQWTIIIMNRIHVNG